MSSAYVDAFIRYLTDVRQLSQHTAEAYAHDSVQFMDFLADMWGEERSADFASVSYKTVRQYIVHLHRQRYEKSSIGRKLAALRSFFRFLVAEELVDANPAELVRSPKQDKLLPDFLYSREIVALLTAPDSSTLLGRRDRAILELLYATGMRRSELVTLQVDDVDLDAMQARVTGKGNKVREVYFGGPAREALQAYLSRSRPELLRKRERASEEPVCFLSKTGRPLNASYIYTLVRKYVLQIGASSEITPHVLRHTFATDMLTGGADLRTVQELLGHSSLRSTEIYTHVTTQRLKDVYSKAHPLATGDKT